MKQYPAKGDAFRAQKIKEKKYVTSLTLHFQNQRRTGLASEITCQQRSKFTVNTRPAESCGRSSMIMMMFREIKSPTHRIHILSYTRLTDSSTV